MQDYLPIDAVCHVTDCQNGGTGKIIKSPPKPAAVATDSSSFALLTQAVIGAIECEDEMGFKGLDDDTEDVPTFANPFEVLDSLNLQRVRFRVSFYIQGKKLTEKSGFPVQAGFCERTSNHAKFATDGRRSTCGCWG